MKSAIPAALCLAVFVYSCWNIRQAKKSYFPPGSHYNVQVVVKGPEGEVIPAVERAPQ